MTLSRRLSAYLAPLFATVLLSACGQSDSPSLTTSAKPSTPAAPAAAPLRVGLVMKTLTNPFFIEMERGARRAESELGVTLIVKTAAQETSLEQQVQLVDDLIADKIDALVIAPADSQGIVPSVKRAMDAGIKVVNIDNRIDPDALQRAGIAPIPFISVDNKAGGYQAGKYLASLGKPGAKAVILEGIRSADNARQRFEGAVRGLTEGGQARVAESDTANWKIDEAVKVTKALLTRNPEATLIFAANDMMALGAVKYLDDAGKKGIHIVGYDALSEAKDMIRAGKLAATIDQQAAEQGFQGVKRALQLLKGETVPALTLIDTQLVTAQSLK
jgi:ribose transport system substrate-binding protein